MSVFTNIEWFAPWVSTADRLKRCQLTRPVVLSTSDGRPQCCLRIAVDCRRDLYSAARPSRRNYLITI